MSVTEASKKLFIEAMQWVMDNPEAWQFMKLWAHRQINLRQTFTTTELNYAVKRSGYVKGKNGLPIGFRNSLRAPLTRLLIREIPEVEPLVRLQPSKTDIYFDDVLDIKRIRVKREKPCSSKKRR